MEYQELSKKKGVAGLEVLLSLIAMIFMIGIIVMIFTIAGAKLRDTDAIKKSETVTSAESDVLLASNGTHMTECTSVAQGDITSVDEVYNQTIGPLTTTNYTYSGCLLIYTGSGEMNNSYATNVTITYTHGGGAFSTINETMISLADVPDWFPTFIVLGSLVVLILLVVIIINSIKASGITTGA